MRKHSMADQMTGEQIRGIIKYYKKQLRAKELQGTKSVYEQMWYYIIDTELVTVPIYL